MADIDTQYEDLLAQILIDGTPKGDRTGTGTLSMFGTRLHYDLQRGFPLITTKRVHLRSIVAELCWFLRGETNVAWLHERGVTIWDEWADGDGELGPIYGSQWVNWGGAGVNQLQNVLDTLRANPDDRRMIVSAWNVADLPRMALSPCHVLFQFYVADGRLSCQIYQRSCDMFLGVPFNIASYALLTHMVAQRADLEVGHLTWVGGDTHIYSNHVEQVTEQLSRKPYPFPRLRLRQTLSLFDYDVDDVAVVDYQCHGAIKAPVAI